MDMVCGIMNQSDNSKSHPPGREGLVELTTVAPLWDRFLTIAPLILIGTREADGSDELAPKHMACPVGWQNYFGFVCTPRHSTYKNISRDGVFAITYPKPSQWLQTSLTASPGCDDGGRPCLNLVQKLCGLRALNLLRRSTRVELNQIIDELLFPQTAST